MVAVRQKKGTCSTCTALSFCLRSVLADGPDIDIPDEITTEVGDNVKVTCDSQGHPSAHSYSWQRQDHPEFYQVLDVSSS